MSIIALTKGRHPVIKDALDDCLTPRPNAASLRTIISALADIPHPITRVLDLPCSYLADYLPDDVYFDQLCADQWDQVGSHLLDTTRTANIAALIVFCANRGAQVPVGALEDSLRGLFDPTSHHHEIVLRPLAIAQLTPVFLPQFMPRYGHWLFFGWANDLALVRAWLLHPGMADATNRLSETIISSMRDECLWDFVELVETDPPVREIVHRLIRRLTPRYAYALLASATLPSQRDLRLILDWLGNRKSITLHGLPKASIPASAWSTLPGPVALQALTFFYEQETLTNRFLGEALPQEVLDQLLADCHLRGSSEDVITRFRAAHARHLLMQTHQIDASVWLSVSLHACFSDGFSTKAELRFLRRFARWVDEDPAAREAVAEQFLEYWHEWHLNHVQTIDISPDCALTATLYEMNPSFLQPFDPE